MSFLTNLFKPKKIEKAVHTQYVPVVPGTKKGKSEVDKLFFGGVNYQLLRDFSTYYPILRSCINYRKRQITQLDWNIVPREVILDVDERKKAQKTAKEIYNFLRFPTGQKHITMRHFLSQIIEDLVVLDACSIYKKRNRLKGIVGYQPIDATTIEFLLKENGEFPDPPSPAYQQTINGKKTARFTTNDIIYRMMNPRTNTPYGFSPVEALIVTVSTALKLSSFNLAYLTENNVPEGFVELPKDIASSPDQLKEWQKAWDAIFSGNPAYQSKIKFLPEGMKLHQTKKQEDILYQRFEEWLLLTTCSVLEVPPQSIGFQMERGKGATEAEWEIGRERGLFPLANIIKEIMDEIVQIDLGYTEFEFNWTNINPTNKKDEAKVAETFLKYGVVSVDEVRIAEGFAPIGLGPFIQTSKGVVMVEDLINREVSTVDPTGEAFQDGVGVSGNKGINPDNTTGNDKKDNKRNKKNDEIEDLKKWKKMVLNDHKNNQKYRMIKSDNIDEEVYEAISNQLPISETKGEIVELFDSFINRNRSFTEAVSKLYTEINDIISK